jgi:hypothetical protein
LTLLEQEFHLAPTIDLVYITQLHAPVCTSRLGTHGAAAASNPCYKSFGTEIWTEAAGIYELMWDNLGVLSPYTGSSSREAIHALVIDVFEIEPEVPRKETGHCRADSLDHGYRATSTMPSDNRTITQTKHILKRLLLKLITFQCYAENKYSSKCYHTSPQNGAEITPNRATFLCATRSSPTPKPMHIQMKIVMDNSFSPGSINLFAPSQQLLINFHAVNALFGELECGEENGVDDAGAGHGYTQPYGHKISSGRDGKRGMQWRRRTSIHPGI